MLTLTLYYLHSFLHTASSHALLWSKKQLDLRRSFDLKMHCKK